MEHGLMFALVVLLAAGVLFVPLTQRLGIGSVLGYLAAGVVIGPSVLGLIPASEDLAHVSEMGVVFLLFIIGLELEPRRLWNWRMQIFGMGTVQVAGISAVGAAVFVSLGFTWAAGAVIGVAVAMSSTAVASQFLRDRNLLPTKAGSSAFSILLFQDIAVIPVLAVLPLLAGREAEASGAPAWKILLVVVGVILAGRFLIRHVLRLVAGAHLREVFTALSLLIVLGLAALMQSLGMSMALGAFMGGVVLATSEYRHAIESDIEPFKGLLLGLFFMSVGMSVDLGVLADNPFAVAAALFGFVSLKFAAHAALGRAFGVSRREIPVFAILLSQVGEFAFVLLASARELALIDGEVQAILAAAVAMSMVTTPLLFLAYDRWLEPRLRDEKDMSGEVIVDDSPEVLIAGFGRVGQIVGRLLYANRIRATVLDHDPDQIELLRQFGFKIYYGDATRLDLLEAAGAKNAKTLVVAVDDVEDSLQIVDLAREHFPHLRLIVRARNMGHVYDLIDREICAWERETFDSSLRMGVEVLKSLGWEPYSAVRASNRFREHNLNMIFDLHAVRKDQEKLVSAARQAREDLERMFEEDQEHRADAHESWEIHPAGR